MERGRGLRLTTNRVLLFVAVVVLVLLAFASALGEVEMGSGQQLDKARSLAGTVMPDGSTHP